MAQLLDLAPEILVRIFLRLCYQELLHCLRVCHLFFDIITKSVELDYHIHLQVAGAWHNPACSMPIPSQLALLKKREESWNFVKPSKAANFPIPGVSALLFDLSSTVFSLGTAPNEHSHVAQGIQFARLPALSEDGAIPDTLAWDFIDLGMTIIEYGLSIEVNDLLVLVISEADDIEPSTAHLAIVLLQYSTKRPHELAENAVFPLCTATEEMGIPSIGIEVSGENLAVSIVFEEPTARGVASTLCVFNWRTGNNKTEPLAYRIPVFNTSLIFLHDDILLNPNSFRNSIDIYHIMPSNNISESDSPEKVVRLIHSLSLPALAPEVFIISISCIGRPSFSTEFPKFMQSNKPYSSDPANAVIPFFIEVLRSSGEQSFCLIAHRQSLLDLIPRERIGPDSPGASVYQGIHAGVPLDECSMQPWDAWGPPITRWFNNNLASAAYITLVSGSRFIRYLPSKVRLSQDEHTEPRNTIHICNFNPAMIKLSRHRKLDEKVLDEAVIKIIDGPEDQENVCPSEGFFASDLVGKLPYILCTSKRKWDFDEVLLSDDYLLGLKKLPNSHCLKEMVLIL